jgi:hypothetical protein
MYLYHTTEYSFDIHLLVNSSQYIITLLHHLINLVYIIAINQRMKVGTKIMSLVFLLNRVPGSLLPYPMNSENVQLHRWRGVAVSHAHSTQQQ